MRRFFKTVSVVMLCGILSCQMAEGRGRNNGNTGGGQRPETSQSQSGRPGGASDRPSNAPAQPGHGGGGNPGSGHGYGQQPGHGPGGPGGNNYGPGYGHNPGHGPGGNNYGPSYGHNPGHGPGGPGYGHNPGYGPGPGPAYGAPYRPYMPPPTPYRRPVPPAYYTPGPGPIISTILGIALGTTLNYGISMLPGSGYSVAGYGNDAIYLNNVYQLNLLWPNATMFYTNGLLTASEFAYSTPYYDMGRYNQTYMMLNNAYGMPVSTGALPGGGMTSTWWNAAGQYIVLQYAPATAANGTYRYYTTLSFGN